MIQNPDLHMYIIGSFKGQKWQPPLHFSHVFLNLRRHPVTALALALTAYQSNPAYAAHHRSGREDATRVKSMGLSRMQTCVLDLPLTVCP